MFLQTSSFKRGVGGWEGPLGVITHTNVNDGLLVATTDPIIIVSYLTTFYLEATQSRLLEIMTYSRY